MSRSFWSGLVVASWSLVGCGATESPPGEPPPPPETDETAPRVASSIPDVDGTGVPADAIIVITFSEPMDAASVEAAYVSTDLPAAAVAFSWNADDTVLTITPSAPLEYASGVGTDLAAVPARRYQVSVGQGATDLAGNPLAAPFDLAFATRRRLVASFPINAEMTRVLRNGVLLSAANPIWAGDNSVAETYRSYLTFELATLPAGAEIEGAEIQGRQMTPSGAPYGLGALIAEHVNYAASSDAAAALPMGDPLTFSTDATAESKRLDVSDELRDHVDHRVERRDRAQFRLRFEQATNSNNITDTAVFAKDTFTLNALYVVD